ncbi:MAG: DODA-type extradiol aromatic ring-opening family dioxygenase [Leptospirillum sp.]
MEILPILAPHSPDLLESYRRGNKRPILEALSRFHSHLVSRHTPIRAVISMSAGWQVPNIILVDNNKKLESSQDYSGFGSELQYDPNGDPPLANAIIAGLKSKGVPSGAGVHGVDHIQTVPLFFLIPDASVPVVVTSQPLNHARYIHLLGEVIKSLAPSGHGTILLLLSGMLAQNERIMARNLPDQLFEKYVDEITRMLQEGESIQPLNIPKPLVERAAPPGKLRELHLLASLGCSKGIMWAMETGPGTMQVLMSFPPIELRGNHL